MNYKYIKAPVLSIAVTGEHVLALIREGDKLYLVSLNRELESEDKIFISSGSKGFVLYTSESELLLILLIIS